MSDQVLLALIAAVASTVASIAAALLAFYGAHKINKVEQQTDGMSHLLAEQARAVGFDAGRAAVRAGDVRPNDPESGQPR